MNAPSIESLGTLVQFCETFAKQRLREAGNFIPFGAFVNREQGLEHLNAYSPSPQLGFEMLGGAVQQLARDGKLVAYAVASNVSIPSEYQSTFTDGIRIQVEAPGYSRFLYTPYRILPFQTLRKFLAVVPTIEYGPEIAVDIPASIFRAETAA
jgi:hypothetical protein